jgi:Ran GTPase-activating protein (RanGAP) involved in mRNA processing and transport
VPLHFSDVFFAPEGAFAAGLFRLLTPQDVCALRLVHRELRETIVRLPWDWSAWRDAHGHRERAARVDPLHIVGWRTALPRARSLSLERRMQKRGFSLAVFAAELAERPPTELRVLDLSHNGEAFGAQGARVFAAAALPSCAAQLVELNLAGCNVRGLGAFPLAAALPGLKRLAALDISANKLGPHGALALSGALLHCHALRELQLAFNHIEDSGLELLAPMLGALDVLDLSTNSIGAAGVEALASEIRGGGTGDGSRFKKRLLAFQAVDGRIGNVSDETTKAAEALYTSTRGGLGARLAVLRLADNRLGAGGAQWLASILPRCVRLAELDLHDTDLADDGVHALSAALPQCAALAKLLLGSNRIGVEGARALASAVQFMPALTTLELADNFAGDEGAAAFAAVLPRCAALMRLTLGRNGIGAAGAALIAAALPLCRSLKSVEIDAMEEAAVAAVGAAGAAGE